MKEDNYYIYIRCECGYNQRVSRSMVIKNKTGYKIIKPFSCKCKNPDNNIYISEKKIIPDASMYKKQNYIEEETPKDNITCPKCGLEQIQLVNRKWSWFAGLFTSKIDRVCVNCKHKF